MVCVAVVVVFTLRCIFLFKAIADQNCKNTSKALILPRRICSTLIFVVGLFRLCISIKSEISTLQWGGRRIIAILFRALIKSALGISQTDFLPISKKPNMRKKEADRMVQSKGKQIPGSRFKIKGAK